MKNLFKIACIITLLTGCDDKCESVDTSAETVASSTSLASGGDAQVSVSGSGTGGEASDVTAVGVGGAAGVGGAVGVGGAAASGSGGAA